MDITRDTFVKLPAENKLDVLFDLLLENETNVNRCNEQINRRKKIDTTTAGLMGFVGGLVGFFSSKLVGGN